MLMNKSTFLHTSPFLIVPNCRLMKKLYALAACLVLLGATGARLSAQTTLTTTTTFLNNNGSGTVTFNLQNTNSSGVIITDIAGVAGSSGTQNVEFWYNPTPING